MATNAIAVTGSTFGFLPVISLWRREVVRFYRNLSRVVGILASPLLFWIVMGSGFGTSFRNNGANQHYLDFFFPGTLIMIVLFTSIFAMMSLIEDRNEGFLLSVLVAPVSRSVIVLGKILGGTTLAVMQGVLFLVAAPFLGIHFTAVSFLLILLDIFLVSFSLTALGFIIAWPMDSTQGFHAIINLFLIPLWLLSGSLFPYANASRWVQWVMRINPLSYGTYALRTLLFPATAAPEFPIVLDLAVLAGFTVLMFFGAFAIANRRTNKPAA